MKKITAYIITAIAVILAGLLVYDYASDYFASKEEKPNLADSSTGSSISKDFPALETRLLTQSWFEQNYPAPSGYVWKLNSDNKGKIPTKEWLQSVWDMSQSYDEGTSVSKSEQRNKFVRAAMRNQDVAYLERENDNSGGVAFIVIYYDENDEIQVKEFDEDLINFDLDKSDDMDKVFVPPQKVVSESATASVLEEYQRKLENATTLLDKLSEPAKDPETNVVKETKTEPVKLVAEKAKVNAYQPVSLDGTSAGSSTPAQTTSEVAAYQPVNLD